MCHPSDIRGLLRAGEPTQTAVTGSWGTSNCGMFPEQTSCTTQVGWGQDSKASLGVVCDRVTPSDPWTCLCLENAVQTGTGTGVSDPLDPGLLRLCFSQDRLICFYANQSGVDCAAAISLRGAP